MRPIRSPYLIIGILLLFISACSMTQLQQEALTSVGASTSGYVIGDKKPELIDPLLKWNDVALRFLDSDTATDAGLETLMQKGFDLLVDDEFLQFQFGNFLKVFDFNLGIEIETPALLTEDYKTLVKEALVGFKVGLLQAKKIS